MEIASQITVQRWNSQTCKVCGSLQGRLHAITILSITIMLCWSISLETRQAPLQTSRRKGGGGGRGLVNVVQHFCTYRWHYLIGWFLGNYPTCTGLPYHKPLSFTQYTFLVASIVKAIKLHLPCVRNYLTLDTLYYPCSDSPPATIPAPLVVTYVKPDVVIVRGSVIRVLELTCSMH